MGGPVSLDDLWNSTAGIRSTFDPTQLSGIPDEVRHYLRHSIAIGTQLATSVRLKMHGEIKLAGWHSFRAEEVICWDQGMIWKAEVRMFGIPVRGSDRLLDGHGEMRWKLFGILPLVNVSGPDISRSAAGRVNIESVWLPSILSGDRVCWTAQDAFHIHAQVEAHNETAKIQFLIQDNARLKSVCMSRWGNPGGERFRYEQFGGVVDAEGSFGGYTIPTQMRIGWYFGTDRFEVEGEFFRVTIDDAIYR